MIDSIRPLPFDWRLQSIYAGPAVLQTMMIPTRHLAVSRDLSSERDVAQQIGFYDRVAQVVQPVRGITGLQLNLKI